MANRGVLIIVQNLPVPYDRRTWNEAQTLCEANERVYVICPTGQDGSYTTRYEQLNGIRIYRYPAPPDAHNTLSYIFEFAYCWLWTAMLSFWIFIRHRFDILHSANPPETYFLLALLYRPFGVRFIFDHHDLSPEMYLAKRGRAGGLLHRALLQLEKWTLQTADIVITTNNTQRQIAIERAGISTDIIFVVRNGPRSHLLYPVTPDPTLKHHKPYLISYLGEMGSQDGVAFMLEVAQYIYEDCQRHDIHMVLIGGGPMLETLQAYATQLDLGHSVTFTGRLGNEDIRQYLSTADVCAIPDMPSAYNHACSMNKVMEYMIFGKPIVSFDLHENRISAQDAAVYVEEHTVSAFAHTLLDLLDDTKRRYKMGIYARQRALDTLVWEHSVPHLLAAYEAVRQ